MTALAHFSTFSYYDLHSLFFYSLLLITKQTAQLICLGCKSQMHIIVTIIYYNYKLQVYNKLRIMITRFITLQVIV